jgi:hypothetical protein
MSWYWSNVLYTWSHLSDKCSQQRDSESSCFIPNLTRSIGSSISKSIHIHVCEKLLILTKNSCHINMSSYTISQSRESSCFWLKQVSHNLEPPRRCVHIDWSTTHRNHTCNSEKIWRITLTTIQSLPSDSERPCSRLAPPSYNGVLTISFNECTYHLRRLIENGRVRSHEW